MHFGGVHFLYGLFFVVCTMVLTIVYLYGAYLAVYGLLKSIYSIRYYNAKNRWIAGRGPAPEEALKPLAMPLLNIKYIKSSAVITVVALSLIYLNQRVEWMKDHNSHYKAKEYYVAGQVVFSHRRIMAVALHPENLFMRPYTFLQRIIYDRGTALLPPDDGERHVWENFWFHYLYTRKSFRPYLVGSKKYEPKMVALLDLCWETMNGMATQKINDPAMKRKSLLEFPLLCSYYTLLQGHYTGKFRGSGTKLRQTPYLMDRLALILQWLDQVRSTWEEKGMMAELKTPECAVILTDYQETVLLILQDTALSLVGSGAFECSHPIIQRLYREYLDVMSDDPDRNFFLPYSKKNLKQAKIGYRSTVYEGKGGAANYILSSLCNKKMPEETYSVVSRSDNFCEFYPKRRVEHVYSEELKGLRKGNQK